MLHDDTRRNPGIVQAFNGSGQSFGVGRPAAQRFSDWPGCISRRFVAFKQRAAKRRTGKRTLQTYRVEGGDFLIMRESDIYAVLN